MPGLSEPTAATLAGGPSKAPGRIVALLLAINLLNYIDRYVLAAVLKPIGEEFFGDAENADFWLGLLVSVFLFSYMAAAPVFGWLADKMSRWVIVAFGVIVWSLASGGSGLATTYFMLLATRAFVGIGEAAYGPTAPTMIADLYPVERRGRVLGWFYLAIPVGSALGYVLGGLIRDLWGWRWAFYLVTPPGLLLGVWCLFNKDPRRSGQRPDGVVQSRLSDYRSFLTTPSYIFNTLGMTAMTFALGGIAIWMPTYIEKFRGVPDEGRIAMIFGAITVAAGLLGTVSGSLLGEKLRPRYSGSYFLVSGLGMLAGFPFFLAVLVTPFPAAWVLIFCAEFCLFFNTGPTNTVLANVTHPAVRSSAFAVNILVIHLLGDAISPLLIGGISDLAGGNMNAGFAVLSPAILASGVFWLCGARHLARDTELAPTRLNAR